MSIYDSPEDAVEKLLLRAYALQFTNGTDEQYDKIIEDTAADPTIVVDCHTLDNYGDFFDTVEDDVAPDPENFYHDHGHVKQHFKKEEGTLVLKHFDTLEGDTLTNMAQYIKGLAETADVGIILTAEDTQAIFLGNGDLSGRVRTVDFSDYEPYYRELFEINYSGTVRDLTEALDKIEAIGKVSAKEREHHEVDERVEYEISYNTEVSDRDQLADEIIKIDNVNDVIFA